MFRNSDATPDQFFLEGWMKNGATQSDQQVTSQLSIIGPQNGQGHRLRYAYSSGEFDPGRFCEAFGREFGMLIRLGEVTVEALVPESVRQGLEFSGQLLMLKHGAMALALEHRAQFGLLRSPFGVVGDIAQAAQALDIVRRLELVTIQLTVEGIPLNPITGMDTDRTRALVRGVIQAANVVIEIASLNSSDGTAGTCTPCVADAE